MSSYYEKILATGEVKCIDEEIPFEIPKGWEWCRLNDLALYRKGPFGSSLTKSMFVPKNDQSVKVYEQKNAIQKDFRLGDYYISKEKFEAMQSFIVKPNDIIVSCAGTIGETYLLPLDAPVGIINQALMRVTLFDLSMAEYWQMYFAYMLLNEAQMKGAGSAIKNIPPFEYLKAVLVPVPPLSEQTRLVERYNLLLSLIAKYESEADKLNCLNLNIYDKLKKSVLQEAIQGKLVQQIAEEGTAQELLEQIKEEKKQLVKEGKLKKSALNDSVIFRGDDNKYCEKIGKSVQCIDEEIPFEIPENWVWVRLGTIVDFSKSQSLPSSSIKESTWVLDLEDIEKNSEKLLQKKRMKDVLSKSDKHIFYKGNVLYSKLRPYLNKVIIADEDGACTTEILAFDFGYIYNKYAQLFLMSPFFVDYATADSYGIKMPRLGSKRGNSALIPLPPLKEQQRIVAQIEKLFEQLH